MEDTKMSENEIKEQPVDTPVEEEKIVEAK